MVEGSAGLQGFRVLSLDLDFVLSYFKIRCIIRVADRSLGDCSRVRSVPECPLCLRPSNGHVEHGCGSLYIKDLLSQIAPGKRFLVLPSTAATTTTTR